MSRSRLAFLLLALPLLAACDSNPTADAPGAETAAAPATDTSAVPATADAPAEPNDAAMAPLFGTFAADLGWCDGDSSGDGFPITITPTEFRGRENVCAISDINDAGDGSYEASLTCTGEGQTVDERLALVPIYAPSGEGLRITYLDRGGDPVTLLRCG